MSTSTITKFWDDNVQKMYEAWCIPSYQTVCMIYNLPYMLMLLLMIRLMLCSRNSQSHTLSGQSVTRSQDTSRKIIYTTIYKLYIGLWPLH